MHLLASGATPTSGPPRHQPTFDLLPRGLPTVLAAVLPAAVVLVAPAPRPLSEGVQGCLGEWLRGGVGGREIVRGSMCSVGVVSTVFKFNIHLPFFLCTFMLDIKAQSYVHKAHIHRGGFDNIPHVFVYNCWNVFFNENNI